MKQRLYVISGSHGAGSQMPKKIEGVPSTGLENNQKFLRAIHVNIENAVIPHVLDYHNIYRDYTIVKKSKNRHDQEAAKLSAREELRTINDNLSREIYNHLKVYTLQVAGLKKLSKSGDLEMKEESKVFAKNYLERTKSEIENERKVFNELNFWFQRIPYDMDSTEPRVVIDNDLPLHRRAIDWEIRTVDSSIHSTSSVRDVERL